MTRSRDHVTIGGGSLPADPEAWVRARLGIVRKDGYRLVSDPWGGRVLVSLASVMDHIVSSHDDTRWYSVPAIIPTIKRALNKYHRAANPEAGEPRETITYEATLTTRRSGNPPGYRKERTYFVPTHPLSGRADTLEFATIYPANTPSKVRVARRRAGALLATRSNPSGFAYIGTRDPGELSQAAHCLPGAAPALHQDYSTSGQGRRLLLAVGILTLLHLATREETSSSLPQ